MDALSPVHIEYSIDQGGSEDLLSLNHEFIGYPTRLWVHSCQQNAHDDKKLLTGIWNQKDIQELSCKFIKYVLFTDISAMFLFQNDH